MLYFKTNGTNTVSAIAESITAEQHMSGEWVCRADRWSASQAKDIAESTSALTGDRYVATFREHCYPAIDVVRAPKVGDEVSYGFNGDYYPDGVVTKISASLRRVQTDTGSVYYRRKQTGSWIKGGQWSLVRGHYNEWNREF